MSSRLISQVRHDLHLKRQGLDPQRPVGGFRLVEAPQIQPGDDLQPLQQIAILHMMYSTTARGFEPHELAAAMGFSGEDISYEFAGTKTEKIKQIGNAVSVAKMKACVGAIMADAAPKAKPSIAAPQVRAEGTAA